ncbi:OsmC family protein [Bisgaard Taxon 45]
MKKHIYNVEVEWTGNLGTGTSSYTAYNRNFSAMISGKPAVLGSSDPAFRGDGTRWNPEDMLLTAISACHKLWYLHLCAVNQITVISYVDSATAIMSEGGNVEAGRFISATLKPEIIISAESDIEKAFSLHDEAHHFCFIANSVNFPITINAEIKKDIQR